MIISNSMALMGSRRLLPQLVHAVTVADRGSAGARSLNISIPSVRDGDIMLIFATAGGVSTKTVGTPSGWDSLATANAVGSVIPSYRVISRTYVSTDTTVNVTSNDGLVLMASLQIWRNATLGARMSIAGNSDDPVAPGLTVGSNSSICLISHYNGPANSSTSPTITGPSESTLATQLTSAGNGGAAHWSGFENLLPPGATGTRTFSSSISPTIWRWLHLIQEMVPA